MFSELLSRRFRAFRRFKVFGFGFREGLKLFALLSSGFRLQGLGF